MANKLYKVKIHQHEDWYFATCKTFPGLHVAHTSLAVVLEEIPLCMLMLLKYKLQQPAAEITIVETQPTKPILVGNKTYCVIIDDNDDAW